MALTQDEQDQLLALVRKIDTKEEALPFYNHMRDLVRQFTDIEASQVKRQLRVGDRVWFDAKTRGIVRGTVVKINPTTVKVRADGGVNWKVYPTFLHAE